MCVTEIEAEQMIGLKFNENTRKIDLGIKSFDKALEISLLIEEAYDFLSMLYRVIEESENKLKQKKENLELEE